MEITDRLCVEDAVGYQKEKKEQSNGRNGYRNKKGIKRKLKNKIGKERDNDRKIKPGGSKIESSRNIYK